MSKVLILLKLGFKFLFSKKTVTQLISFTLPTSIFVNQDIVDALNFKLEDPNARSRLDTLVVPKLCCWFQGGESLLHTMMRSVVENTAERNFIIKE